MKNRHPYRFFAHISHSRIGELIMKKIYSSEKLDKQKDFYYINSQAAKTNYKEKYHENIFNTTFKKQFKIS